MRELKGRTAIITGAVGGIGPFIARALAKGKPKSRTGYWYGAGNGREIAEIKKMKVRVIGIQSDVRDSSSLEAVVSKTLQEFGEIDILVNNAGINNVRSYDKLAIGDIERIIRVNLIAPTLLTRLVLPSMIQQKRGHVVVISSLAGEVGTPFCVPYGASKAGLIGFTESLRMEPGISVLARPRSVPGSSQLVSIKNSSRKQVSKHLRLLELLGQMRLEMRSFAQSNRILDISW